jgi:hypothetical protein
VFRRFQVRLKYLLTALLCFALCAGVVKWAFAGVNNWAQLWYVDTTNAQCDSAAARYKYIVGGPGVEGQDITRIKHTNSAVKALMYITPDQNPDGGSNLMSILAQETSDITGCFLHVNDATAAFILNGAEAYDMAAGDKVKVRRGVSPNYVYSYLPNYSTAAKRSVWRRTMARFIAEHPFNRGTELGPDVYPDGVWLDNASINQNLVTDICKGGWCTSEWQCVGHPCDGGHVTEAGGAQLGSTAFQGWWRASAINLFTGTLGDTLRSLGKTFVHNAQPQPGSFAPYNSITAAPMAGSASWGGAYFWEYTVGTVYNSWGSGGDQVADTTYVRYVRARENAIEADSSWSWHSTHLSTCSASIGETIRSNLAMWLTVRAPNSVFQHQGANSAAVDSIIWSPCQRTVQNYLGNASGAPRIKLQGTDPTGKAYAVWGRPYTNGWVLVRPRHYLAQTCEAATAVTVVMSPNPDYFLIHPDGTYGPTLAGSFAVKNGYGIVLLNKGKVPPTEEITEP